MGGLQDLPRQDPRHGRVSAMGSHVSERVAVHLRPRQELQPLRGAHEHDPQGEAAATCLICLFAPKHENNNCSHNLLLWVTEDEPHERREASVTVRAQ